MKIDLQVVAQLRTRWQFIKLKFPNESFTAEPQVVEETLALFDALEDAWRERDRILLDSTESILKERAKYDFMWKAFDNAARERDDLREALKDALEIIDREGDLAADVVQRLRKLAKGSAA